MVVGLLLMVVQTVAATLVTVGGTKPGGGGNFTYDGTETPLLGHTEDGLLVLLV